MLGKKLNKMNAKGLKFGIIGFIVFEALSFFTSDRYQMELGLLVINLIISLVLWMVGGQILTYFYERKTLKSKDN